MTALQVRHDLILGALGEGVYGIDAAGKGTFANKAAEDILGWTQHEMVGHGIHDIHHHSHPDGTLYPREECPIYAALTDGNVHTIDHEVFWHRDGTAIPVEYVSTPIFEEGSVTGAVVVFRDVSSRRALESQRALDFAEITRLKEALELERDYLRDEIRSAAPYRGIVGDSDALGRTLAQIEAVATTRVSVLIQGESGVGKEGIARAIHAQSDRADAPLVKVNCASIPDDLFESEFFGHIRGAFTGAHRDRVGRLQLADGGTLFLDEIGEIPLNLQGKLLRALQEQEFERVGDEKTTKVDVRVIAATNRNLGAEVAAGRFREDLYYRLSVFPVEVPPLRDRKEDIGPLVEHFLTSICTELGRSVPRVSVQQIEQLKLHAWPGNVRELKNVLERAVILSRGQSLNLDSMTAQAPARRRDLEDANPSAEFLTEVEFRELEKSNLLGALTAAGWRVSGKGGAANLLGIKASTCAYRMKQFGLAKR